jgi:hypothetical protein
VVDSLFERWAIIPFWPNYEASSDGRIRNRTSGRIVKQWPKTPCRGWDTPYWCVSLTLPRDQRAGRKKRNKSMHVHRLVCAAFHGPADEGEDAHHKNEDWKDNSADNLEWRPGAEHRAEHNRRAA